MISIRKCNFDKIISISTEGLKRQLHTLIDNTKDEEILNMLKEELVLYQAGKKEFDNLNELNPEDRAELEES